MYYNWNLSIWNARDRPRGREESMEDMDKCMMYDCTQLEAKYSTININTASLFNRI